MPYIRDIAARTNPVVARWARAGQKKMIGGVREDSILRPGVAPLPRNRGGNRTTFGYTIRKSAFE